MEPIADYVTKLPTAGTTGLRLTNRGNGVFITQVVRGNVGERAGAKLGDQVLSVDTQRMDALDDKFVQAVLSGNAGQAARVEIRRRGTGNRVLRLVRQSSLDPSLYLPMGIRIYRESSARGPTFVSEILASSRSWTAGLRAGDVLLAINGRSVRSASVDEIEVRLRRAGTGALTLVVQPFQQKQSRTILVHREERPATVSGANPSDHGPLGTGGSGATLKPAPTPTAGSSPAQPLPPGSVVINGHVVILPPNAALGTDSNGNVTATLNGVTIGYFPRASSPALPPFYLRDTAGNVAVFPGTYTWSYSRGVATITDAAGAELKDYGPIQSMGTFPESDVPGKDASGK